MLVMVTAIVQLPLRDYRKIFSSGCCLEINEVTCALSCKKKASCIYSTGIPVTQTLKCVVWEFSYFISLYLLLNTDLKKGLRSVAQLTAMQNQK
jgi:hypothetical protein